MADAPPTLEPPAPSLPAAGPRHFPASARLALTDFLDLATLQEVQDSFTAVTRLNTIILDAKGGAITAPTDPRQRAESDSVLEHLIESEQDACGRLLAPIQIEGQTLGSIEVREDYAAAAAGVTPQALESFKAEAARLGVDPADIDELAQKGQQTFGTKTVSSVQLLYLMANAIARLCYEQYLAKQRLGELSVLYRMSTALTGRGDVQKVLDTAASSVADAMKVKAASIRLLDGKADKRHLRLAASHGLSEDYLAKGSVLLSQSVMYQAALNGEVIHVPDMTQDDRVLFKREAAREGLVSMVCTGVIFQDRAIGTIQLFTDEPRSFSAGEVNLLRASSQLIATAIESARLEARRKESEQVNRQLHLAADVQRRMLPARMPTVPGLQLAARYVPSYELGGDFYDFIRLDRAMGLAIGDVVGKGVAASLLMASTRAALRFAQDVYDLDEVISRVNLALARDTRDNEFATLWYGTLDPLTMRLTYCNAGHDPPLLLRGNEVHSLETGGMILGVSAEEHYEKGIWDFEPGDLLLLYTDGLPDAFNDHDERFGHERIHVALRECAGKSAGDTLNHVLYAMRQHTGPRRGNDDTTIVVMRIEP